LEKKAKELSKKAHKKTNQIAISPEFEKIVKEHGTTQFLGYETLISQGKVIAIFRGQDPVQTLKRGEEGSLLLDQTPFYAEQGGQIGDSGLATKQNTRFVIHDTTAPFKGAPMHFGTLEKGEIQVGDTLELAIDEARRKNIAIYHSATHLLHWALVQVLGPHVKQAGSLVSFDRLRFDFSHHKALEQKEIDAIENLINEKVFADVPIQSYEKKFAEIKQDPSIKQFFGEKYGDVVRVVDIDFSKELCGGTHTTKTSDICLCKITKETAIAAGVRRIEAACSKDALHFVSSNQQLLQTLSKKLATSKEKLESKIDALIQEKENLHQELKGQHKKKRQDLAKHLLQKATKIDSFHFLVQEVDVNGKELKDLADDLFSHIPSGIIAIGSKQTDSCQILVRVSNDLISQGFSAKELLTHSFDHIDGKGGGKEPLAQAGGRNPKGLQDALQAIQKAIETKC